MSEKPEMKFIDENMVPRKIRDREKLEEWIRLLKQIPKGKALVLNEDDPIVRRQHVELNTIRAHINHLIREEKVPDNFKMVLRKTGDAKTLYIINSTGSEQE
jgi:hypothetical protein